MNAKVIKWGRWRIAWTSSSNLDSVTDLLSNGEIDGVGLASCHGYTGNAAWLGDLPSFTGIVVTEADSFDFQAIPRLDEMRFLTLGGKRSRGLDFRRLDKLVDLRVCWHPDDLLPPAESCLDSLYLRGYRTKEKDLSSIAEYKNLEELELVQAGITRLDGVGSLRKLRKLELSNCYGLTTVAALVGTSVEEVRLEACGKVSDIALLSQCSHIRSISLESCGNLQSLSFLRASKTIEKFNFVKMIVADGDMTPLLNLKRAGFINRRGYSHTNEEVSAIIAKHMADLSPSSPRDGQDE